MPFQDILIPTDFGPGSRTAVERALDSLGVDGGRLVVLHVLDQRLLDHTLNLVPTVHKEELLSRLHKQAHEQYAGLIAGLDRDGVEFEPLVVEGVPFLKIVQFAHDLDVDLIVMAVHRGPDHFEEILFGSTAERVMRITPCPVLIVPETRLLRQSESRG